MCIRDRIDAYPRFGAQFFDENDVHKAVDRSTGCKIRADCTSAPQTTHANRFRPVYRNNRRIPCLLYTSDAADERSSVDLGGRRIIKKKKNNHSTSPAATKPNHKTETQNQH